MKDRLEYLLEDLSEIFGITLHEDRDGGCSIQIPPILFQVKLDAKQEALCMFAIIFELPPGGFRNKVLLEALQYNGTVGAKPAVLSFVPSQNGLAAHQFYPLSILNQERLKNFVGGFLDLCFSWHSSLERGLTPPLKTQYSP